MAKDIILDDNNDLQIRNGDFVIGASEAQEVYLILNTNQGEWKQSLLTGFGFIRRIRAEQAKDKFKADLDTQLRLDGFKNIKVSFSGNMPIIEEATR